MGPALVSLLSHWRRNPTQLAMLWLGLALATALWSGVQAINAEARSSYDAAAATLGQDQLARLVAQDGGPVAMTDYVALRRAGYRVSPVITGEVRDENGRLRLIGIDPFTTPEASNAPALGGEGVDAVAFLGEPGLLLMSETTAQGALPEGLPPLAVVDAVPPAAAITDIATAARLLATHGPRLPDRRAGTARRPATASRRVAPEARAAGNHRRCGAADGQLSPQPDGLRAAVLRCWALHRSCRHRAGLRAAPRDVPHAARRGPAAAHADRGAGRRGHDDGDSRRCHRDRAGLCHRGGADAGRGGDAAGALRCSRPGNVGLRPDLGAFGPWHHPAGRCCRLGAGDAAHRAHAVARARTATRLGAGLGPGDAATGACRTGPFCHRRSRRLARLRPSGGLHPSRRAPAWCKRWPCRFC